MHPSLLSSARGEFGEHRDYSGRRQLKQQSDARYQALLNSDSTGIYSCDATGLITISKCLCRFRVPFADHWTSKP